MPAQKIVAPFKDKEVLVVIRAFHKVGAQKSVIAKELKTRGHKKIPARAVDRALLRLRDEGLIVSERRRWFIAA